jgi:hypothetical protein
VAISAAVARYSESSIEPSTLFRGAILFRQMAPDNLDIAYTDRLFLSRITYKSTLPFFVVIRHYANFNSKFVCIIAIISLLPSSPIPVASAVLVLSPTCFTKYWMV